MSNQVTIFDKLSISSLLFSLYFTCNSLPVILGDVDNVVILFIIVVFVVSSLYSIKYLSDCKNSPYVIIFLLLAFLFSMISGENGVIKHTLLSFVCYGFPVLLVPFSQINFEKVIKYIALQGIIFFPFFISYDYGFVDNTSFDSGDLMTMSYRITPYIVACFLASFDRNNRKIVRYLFLLLAVSYTCILFVVGSRGAQLSVLIFLVIYYILDSKTSRIKMLKIFILSLFIILFVSSFSAIVHFLAYFLNSNDISSLSILRLEDMLNNGRELDTGRSELIHLAWMDFCDSPVFGKGISSFDHYSGGYPHNIFIQLLGEGGLIFGFFFFLLANNVIHELITNTLENGYTRFLFFLLCAGVIKLFFSSTYWESQFFWALVSIIVNRKFINRFNQPAISTNDRGI